MSESLVQKFRWFFVKKIVMFFIFAVQGRSGYHRAKKIIKDFKNLPEDQQQDYLVKLEEERRRVFDANNR